jgi:glutamine synthetase
VTSGASWAPNTPTFGGNDRTHYIRIPDNQRIELRGGCGSANPYLAAAAAIGAGLYGVENKVDPGELGAQATHRPALPATLIHAVETLEADPVMMDVLNAAGDGVAEYFTSLKREEFFTYHSQVSSWEIDQYLTAF